jgi:hypothetical protein
LISISAFNGLSLEKNKGVTLDGVGKGLMGTRLATACMSALTSSIPPKFCYKKGTDFGVIPTGCPKGYFRSIALCYEECPKGWKHILGICYKGCDKGYNDHGLSCFKNLFRFYFKESRIPKSLTNFSSKIPCPGDMYRSGALCYRDCNIIGLSNCGIGACSTNTAQCVMTIFNMVLTTLEGLYTGAVLIASFGTSAGATTSAKVAIKAGVKALGKAASKASAKAALKSVRKVLSGKFKKTIKKIAINQLKNNKQIIKELVTEKIVETVCQQVWDAVSDKTQKSKGIEEFTDKLIDTVDVIGVKGMMEDCSDTSDGGFNCAKSIIGGLEAFDPTGLLTIVSAFLEPVCDIPVNDPNKEIVLLEEEKRVEKEEKKDWIKNCKNLWYDKRNERIQAICDGKNLTKIDLNRCLGNRGGKLVWGNGFQASCRHCENSRGKINCECKGGALNTGSYQETSIELKRFLGNENGVLKCIRRNSFFWFQ